MPSSHLILCRPLLLLPSIFPSISIFSNESVICIRWPKYWSFQYSTGVYRGALKQEMGSKMLFLILQLNGTQRSRILFFHYQSLIPKLEVGQSWGKGWGGLPGKSGVVTNELSLQMRLQWSRKFRALLGVNLLQEETQPGWFSRGAIFSYSCPYGKDQRPDIMHSLLLLHQLPSNMFKDNYGSRLPLCPFSSFKSRNHKLGRVAFYKHQNQTWASSPCSAVERCCHLKWPLHLYSLVLLSTWISPLISFSPVFLETWPLDQPFFILLLLFNRSVISDSLWHHGL